jgi:hypothetical protein
MKRFYFKVFCFIFPIALFAFPIDYFISERLKNTHDYPAEYEIWNNIYNSSIDVNVAIYGSSRAKNHFDPKIIEDSLKLKSFVLGIDGHNFLLQYLMHKEYFKYNSQPNIIIYSVDLWSLVERKDLFQMNQFMPFMLWNIDIYDFTNSLKGFSRWDYFIPLIRYSGDFLLISKIFSNNTDNYYYNGYRGIEDEWNNDLAKARNEFGTAKIEIDPRTLDLMEQFIVELQEKKIDLIFVYSPDYVGGHAFFKNREEIIYIFNSLSEKFSIPFLDYSNDPICKEKKYFHDNSHLNKEGAELFTQKLIVDIKKQLVVKRTINNAGIALND